MNTRRCFTVLLALAAATPLVFAQSLEMPKGRTVLSVSGKIGASNKGELAVFDMAMIEKLPQHSFTTRTPWYDKPVKFTGPLLADVLAAVKASGTSVSAVAINDYRVTIPAADATTFKVIVAHLIESNRGLHAKVSSAMDNNPSPFGFASDPLGEPAKPGDDAPAVVAVDAPIENILTYVLALDADSGIVAFSVGEANGIKAKDIFDVKIAGKKVGKVQISTVKGVLSFGQLQPDKELDIRAISKADSVSLAPSTKITLN